MWPHILGLDVALAAILWQELAGRALGTSTDPAVRAVLFCAVWGIYLLDRAWDAARFPPEAILATRHRVARRWLPCFAGLGIANLAAAGVVAVSSLDVRLLVAGAAIATLCCGYYFLQARAAGGNASPWRATILAAIFAVAVMAAALVQSPSGGQASGFFIVMGTLLAANALECMQAEERLTSCGSEYGGNGFLIVAAVIAAGYAIVTGQFAPTLTAASLVALKVRQRDLPPDAYSALADAALLVPAVCLPWM